MKQRYHNPNATKYRNYGGKGVKVCDEWLNDFAVFRDFALSYGYIDDLSVDRINNDGNYEPRNVQFIPISENTRKDHLYRALNQYDLKGNLVGYYYSTDQASRVAGVHLQNIWSVCNGRIRTAGNYIWQYAN